MPDQSCVFGDDEGGACEAPAAWVLTAGGVAHPVCQRHRDAAEDRLTDLEARRADAPALVALVVRLQEQLVALATEAGRLQAQVEAAERAASSGSERA
jgi:hypothetical protein